MPDVHLNASVMKVVIMAAAAAAADVMFTLMSSLFSTSIDSC
jgi:hypothetical protein